MAAERVKVESGEIYCGTTGEDMQYLVLDSWKAELELVTNKAAVLFYIDGSPMTPELMAGGPSQQIQPIRMEFGGMVTDAGHVNLNHRLEFTMNGQVSVVAYVLTKTYLDPALVDPSKR